jgi:hypothetical protein
MIALRRDDLAQGLAGDGVVVGDENRIRSVERHEADSHSPKTVSRLHPDTPVCTSCAATGFSSLLSDRIPATLCKTSGYISRPMEARSVIPGDIGRRDCRFDSYRIVD